MKSFEIRRVFLTDDGMLEEIARVQSASNIADERYKNSEDVDVLVGELKQNSDKDYMLMAYFGDEAIGYVSDSFLGECLSMWVKPEHRDNGVEETLLSSIEVLLRMNGVSEVSSPIDQIEWLNVLLHKNGYIYLGGDYLEKNLRSVALRSA